jgi:hypothetical protein
MIDFKVVKKIELDLYDLIKRYEKTGTKEQLLEELKELDKNMLKGQRQKPAAVKEIEKALEISKNARRNDNTSWRAGNIAGLEKALRIIEEENQCQS